MGTFQIIREREDSEHPTMGLLHAGDLELHTLELPWRENAPRISCIPKGRYRCVLAWSDRFARIMPRLMNVPSRDGILIHSGNSEANTEGCVLLGMERDTRLPILYRSKQALECFVLWLGIELKEGDVWCEVTDGV